MTNPRQRRPNPPKNPARPAWDYVLAGVFLALFLLASNNLPLGHHVDDLKWILHAENLLRGSWNIAWMQAPTAETTIDWGFSLLLLPAVALFGRAALALKLYAALLLFAGHFLLYKAVRDSLEEGERRLLLIAVFFNGFLLSYSGNVTSESGYCFLLGALVYGFFPPAGRPLKPWAAGALTGLLVLTRSVGVAAFAALAGVYALGRRWREGTLYAVGAAAIAVPYFLYCRINSPFFTIYQQHWSLRSWGDAAGILSTAAQNFYYYAKGLSSLTFFYLPALLPPAEPVKISAIVVVFGLAAIGAWKSRGAALHHFWRLHGAACLGICLFFSYRSPRYILPFFFFAAYAFVVGLRVVPGRWRSAALAAAALLAAVSNTRPVAGVLRASITGPLERPHAAYTWLAQALPGKDPVVSMDIATIHYFTGKKGFPFLPSSSVDEFIARARQWGVRVFVAGEADYVETVGVADPILAQHETLSLYLKDPRFRLIHDEPEERVRIFTLDPAG